MALTDYSWDGLWRASFSGSPWNGTASAGGSSSRELTEGTTPPGTGTAQNGYTPARFDGVNDFLTLEGVDTDYLATGAFTIHAVVKPVSLGAPQTYYWDEECLLVQPGSAGIAIGLSSSGVGLEVYDSMGAQQTARASLHSGYNVIQAKFDGTNAKIRTNGGAWQSVAADSVYLGGVALEIGRDYVAAAHGNFDLFEFAIAKVALSDSQLDDCRNDSELRLATALSGSAALTFGASVSSVNGNVTPDAATLTFGGSIATMIGDVTPDAATLTFGGSCTLALDSDLYPDAATLTFGGSCTIEGFGDLAPDAATLTFGGSCAIVDDTILPGPATLTFGGSCAVYTDTLIPSAATLTFGGSCSIVAVGATARVYSAPFAKRTDIEAQGLDRLIDEYRNNPEQFPVLYGLLRAFLARAQASENSAYEVLLSRYPNEISGYGPASDVRLDVLGVLVGELRKGRADASYLRAIKLRSRINRSKGKRKDLYEIVRLITTAPFIYSDDGGLEFEFDFKGLDEDDIATLVSSLIEARPGAYRARVAYSTIGANVLTFGYNGTAPKNGSVLGYDATINGTFAGSQGG